MDVFFLGAGQSMQEGVPAALLPISHNRRALDWQLQSLTRLPEGRVHFIGGFHFEEVVNLYPQLNYTLVPDWRDNTVIHSLYKAPFDRDQTALVMYSDTLFRPNMLAAFAGIDSDVVIGVDSSWLTRYESRSADDIANAEVIDATVLPDYALSQSVEFTGLLKLSPRALAALQELDPSSVQNIPELISQLAHQGLGVRLYDFKGDWAEFNSDLDIAHFILGTKSETLYRLYPLVKSSVIGQQVTFTVSEWQQRRTQCVEKIQRRFPAGSLVVRSSSFAEDCWDESHAGGFESVLNVKAGSETEIEAAVTEVIASYGGSESLLQDQILVQEQLMDVAMSGVVFTRSLETGAPYYRLNYDDKTASTDAVTSGLGQELRTVIVSKAGPEYWGAVPPQVLPVLHAVDEIETLLGYDRLDIEFAVTNDGVVHVFQVRPIAVKHKGRQVSDGVVFEKLHACQKAFAHEQTKAPDQYGEHCFFGVMPDWNPAEIIGVKPQALAYSLYRYLITDEIWAAQRAEFGYHDMRGHALIRTFAGQPYVDIRNSLNSFLPASLEPELKQRLADAYSEILVNNPQFHDKLEFDVVFTVLSPAFQEKALKRLLPHGLAEADVTALADGLRLVTANAFGRLASDIQSAERLTFSRDRIKASGMNPLKQALLLLDACRRDGTLAFAHAARAGFVAMTFLNDLVELGLLHKQRKEQFLSSFNTVAGEFEHAMTEVHQGKLSLEELIAGFGHLRPGTYDITAKAYWEDPEKYLLASAHTGEAPTNPPFEPTAEEADAIKQVMANLGLNIGVDAFFDYCEKATQAREQVKFEFSKNLSAAMDQLVVWGKQVGLKRKQLAALSLNDLKEYDLGVTGLSELKKRIKLSKKRHNLTTKIELPQLITKGSDFYGFERNQAEPNFVTSQSIECTSVWLADDPASITGQIVFIEQADPGYDWMFAHDIAGLITKYGGANSHMAIRSAELNLPAAIGVGDHLYDELKPAKIVRLNCGLRQIIKVQ